MLTVNLSAAKCCKSFGQVQEYPVTVKASACAVKPNCRVQVLRDGSICAYRSEMS